MSNVAKLKKKAADFELKRQFDKALAIYVDLLDDFDANAHELDVALFNRVGDMLLRQGNVADAVEYYERAVDRYAEGGFFNNAIALCNKILRQSPGRTSIYYKLGRISAQKGFKADAKQNFLEYADRMQKAGRMDEAFRALKEFADLCPDQDDIRLMLAEQLSRQSRGGEAIEQLQTLFDRYSSDGRDTEARATLDRIRAIDPSYQPRVTGTQRAQKASDLVFLDLYGDEPAAEPEELGTTTELAFVDLDEPFGGSPEAATDAAAPGDTGSPGMHRRDEVAPPEDPAPVAGLETTTYPATADVAGDALLDLEPTVADPDASGTATEESPRLEGFQRSTFADSPAGSTPPEPGGAELPPVPEAPGPPELFPSVGESAAAPQSGVQSFDSTFGDAASFDLTQPATMPTAVPTPPASSRVRDTPVSPTRSNPYDAPRSVTPERGPEIDLPELQFLVPAADELANVVSPDASAPGDPGERPADGAPPPPLDESFGELESSFLQQDGSPSVGHGEFRTLPGDAVEPGTEASVPEVHPGEMWGLTFGQAPPVPTADPAPGTDAGMQARAADIERAAFADAWAAGADDDVAPLPGRGLDILEPLDASPEFVSTGLDSLVSEASDPADAADRDLTAEEAPAVGRIAAGDLETSAADETATVDDPAFDDATLDDATLDDATLDDTTLDDATVDDATVEDATLEDAALEDAALEDAALAERAEGWLGAATFAAGQSVDRLAAESQTRPDDLTLRRQLGEARLESGDRAGGLADLDAVMIGLERMGDLAGAASIADEVARLTPDAVRIHQKRVEYAFRLSDRPRLAASYLDLAAALLGDGQADKARTVYQRVLDLAPDDVAAQSGIAALDAEPAAVPVTPLRTPIPGAGMPGIPAAAPPDRTRTESPRPSQRPMPEPSDALVNLGDWLRAEEAPKSTRMVVEEKEPSGDDEADFAEMLRKFKQGVAENVDDEDHQSHYDLGVAFREMGLVDEAIAEFQKALRAPAHRLRTYEALGQCFVDKGQFRVANAILARGLAEQDVSDEQLIGVLYLLGACAEEVGRAQEAVEYYQRVFVVDIEFRDVAERLAAIEQAR